MTHICLSKLSIIGSDNGLSPGRRQAIIWTNAGMLFIGHLRTNFNEILIKMYKFSFKKMYLKMLSGKWQPFCLGLNVLTHLGLVNHHPGAGSSFVQAMSCHLFSPKPLPNQKLIYCQLDPVLGTNISGKSIKVIKISSIKCIWKCCLQNVSHFVLVSMGEAKPLHQITNKILGKVSKTFWFWHGHVIKSDGWLCVSFPNES